MTLFVLSSSVVYGVLALWAVAAGRDDLAGQLRLMASVLVSGWLAPTVATWLAAEGVSMLSARRVLERKLSMGVRRIALGMLSGALGSALGVLGMAALDRSEVPDGVIVGAAAAIAATLVLVPTGRVRKGACVYCGYSFAGATPASRGVCAECGAELLANA